MAPAQHFVLTRFNVDIGPHRRSWDEAWLAARFELFEGYCLPSMRAQTEQRFTWIVFFAASSRPTVERFLATLTPMPNLHPVFTDGVFGAATARDAVLARHDGASTRLLTTRLDCDDALRDDVIARLQALDPTAPTEVLNFPLGYQLAHGRFYVTYDPANAFCTLAEPWPSDGAGVATVYSAQHQQIATVAPVRQVGWSPSWLQVVHDDNLANRANGLRIGRRRPAGRFAALPLVAALADREDRRELATDILRSATTLGRKVVTHPAARRRAAALLPGRGRRTRR